ncbi:MAG: N-acetyl-gamma-glutamyl-phosphate reductase [Desulfobacteraceae bacterium]|nr:N-acetyl-gamma-glutamyl-phosphate reductase [Desulfobacteraceae bacterium]
MIHVGIVGAAGYAGAELVRILSAHANVKLTCLTCRQDAGERFDTIYPALSCWADLVCHTYDVKAFIDAKVDLAFIALPHKLPMAIVPELLDNGIKVVDLSADFRFKDVSAYESCYQKHTAAGYLQKAVYGLSEIYSEQIRQTGLVGNPGCYPTSILMPLIPLLKAGLVEKQGIIADSKSGVSGAGRSASAATHYCHVNESFKAYKVASHRHTPEMESVLTDQCGGPIPLVFVPHLVPMTRGMQSTIYTGLKGNCTEADIWDCLAGFYEDKPFVRLRRQKPVDTLHVKGSNFIDIGWKIDPRQNRLVILSVIDNLVKGAAGQAIQNMNLMMGLEQTAGLWQPPCPV